MSDAPVGAPLLLADLTWEETRDLLPGIGLVLVPVGAHEQHGPGVAMATDTTSADALCRAAAGSLGPRVAVAPAIPWGISWHHMAFPGTISLRSATLVAILEDVIGSLHAHGFTRFLVVNGHGGNAAAITTAVEEVKQARDIPFVAAVFGYAFIAEQAAAVLPAGTPGHGGADEAAVVLAAAPHQARPDAFAPADSTGVQVETAALLRAYGGTLARPFSDATRNGVVGDPRAATPDVGRRLLDAAAARLAEVIEVILREAGG